MKAQTLLESRKMPDAKKGQELKVMTEKKWEQLLAGVLAGKPSHKVMLEIGLSRNQFEAAIRTDKNKKAAWEATKLAALRKNWDAETVEEVLTQVAMNERGGHLKAIIDNMGLNSNSFYMLLLKDPEYAQMYEEARQIQAEIQADEMRAIADDGRNDSYVDDQGRNRVDHDVIQRSKLRVDTMKWTMSKLHYKRFGDRIQNDTNMNVTVDYAERLDAARKRLEQTKSS